MLLSCNHFFALREGLSINPPPFYEHRLTISHCVDGIEICFDTRV